MMGGARWSGSAMEVAIGGAVLCGPSILLHSCGAPYRIEHQLGRGEVFERAADRLEQRALGRIGAAHARALAQLGAAASACADAGRWFHTVTSSIGRTARIASASNDATRPLPTISSERASGRARNDAASADAAAVRRDVISLPSSCASGTPV